MGNRFGTESNPIVFVPEVSNTLVGYKVYKKRNLLLECSRLGLLGQNITDVARRPNEAMFVMNIISNPFLKPLEVKVALFLYEKYSFSDGGFVVTSNNDGCKSKFSELGGKEFFYSRKVNDYMDIQVNSKNEIENILKKLNEKLHIVTSASRLMDCLSRLHSFGYITMTKIHYYNSEYGLSELKLMFDEALKNKENREDIELRCQAEVGANSIVKHIRLSEYMGRCDLSNKWRSKLK